MESISGALVQEAASIASDAGVPVWYEPTSVPKSSRALPILRNITFTSPNAKELVAMANGLRAAGGLAALPVSAGMAEVSLDDPPGSPTGSSGQGMVRLRLQALLPHIKTLLQVYCTCSEVLDSIRHCVLMALKCCPFAALQQQMGCRSFLQVQHQSLLLSGIPSSSLT